MNKMGKKLKLSHTEVELKPFLEVLGVYAVLALALISAYYLGPAITGFATVTKQLNYTDEVNLEFSESSEYIWNMANPGNLKSIRIEGSKSREGEAKAYIEANGIRHLVFDSSRLAEKPSGIFGITGFVFLEDKEADKIKTEVEGVLGNEQQTIFDLLVLDINETRNNIEIELEAGEGEVSKEIKGTATELQNGLINNLSLSLENSAEKIKIKIEAEFREQEEEAEIPINEAPIINETPINNKNETLKNETIINETIKKTININLEYGGNGAYDANNDGVETISGVIDFNAGSSGFSWDADVGKLCTRYEIFSAESQESNFVCFGDSGCCALAGLESSRDLWNEGLYLSYGSYGSTANNIVFAQVLYANYSLDIDEPYSEIAYSKWGNLTARFSDDIVEFEDACIDTCAFSGNESSYKLIIEVQNATLWINRIEYTVEESVTNAYPVLLKQIENISLFGDEEYALDLSEYFSDEDGDELAYGYNGIDNMAIRFEGSMAYIRADNGFAGSRLAFITASDSYGEAASNVFKIDAAPGELSIEIADSSIEGNNWTVSFSTSGTGNLTISGSYAELYEDNSATSNNLDILGLKCGNFEIFDREGLIETDNLWFILMNNSKVRLIGLIGESLPVKAVYIENYSCGNEIGHYTARVLAKGESIQEFKFGNKTRTAGIDYAGGALRETFEIRDREGNKLMVLDSFGDISIRGNLTQDAAVEADENDFAIQNAAGDITLAVKNPEGNMLIKGSLNENQSALLPPPDSFIVQNRNAETVAYANSTGSLFLRGELTENFLFR